jgi:hypothetical protein
MKAMGDNMKNQFLKKSTKVAVALALFATLAMVPTARAQIYGPWSAPLNLNNIVLRDGTACPGVVNSTSPDRNDTHPAISKDGLSLYFASTRLGGFGEYDLWASHRNSLDACWGPPVNLGKPVNTSAREFAPNLSSDGHWLFFHSKRQLGSCGNGVIQELWAAHREDISNDLGWETPINLGCAIQGGINAVKNPTSGLLTDSAGPNFFEDGSGEAYLYFTRNAFPGDQQGFHIYVSTCSADIDTCNTQGLWDQGIPVDKLNSPARDTRTAIRRDGLEMILSSGRSPGSLASENLWVSTRPAVTLDQQNWAPPEPVNCDDMPGCSPWNPQGPLVNSDAFDGAPALSRDGTELYFFRVNPVNANNAIGLVCTEGFVQEPPETPDTGPVCRDLYVSKRTYITHTLLSSSPNPSVVGQSVTFTATVSSANDSAPTGSVTFLDGPTSLGTDTLVSGQATFITPSLAVGFHSITGQYSGDRISGVSSGSLTQNVEYGICPLYDQTRSVHSGATFPIKLELCDANGNDVSASTIVVHATSITAVSGFSGTPDASGNANPDNDFRFDATLGATGGYIFNLSTRALASGTYNLQFTAGSDPITHSVNFGVN